MREMQRLGGGPHRPRARVLDRTLAHSRPRVAHAVAALYPRRLVAFLIGLCAGLRALTPAAATAWAVHFGWLELGGALSLIGALPVAIVLTVLAVAELVADKLPNTPARTALPGLTARIAVGALTGACIASAGGQGVVAGVVLGAMGGIVGAYGGYQLRTRLVTALHVPDVFVALLEDVVAIGGALWIASGT